MSTGNTNTAKTGSGASGDFVVTHEANDKSFLDITGRVRADSFTGSFLGDLTGFATSGSIVQIYTIQPGSNSLDNATYSWIKPSWAKRIKVILIGGGGGGGGGSKSTTSSVWKMGGGGGAGGNVTIGDFEAWQLPSTMSVQVGFGGAGGSGAFIDPSGGGHGVNGGDSVVFNSPGLSPRVSLKAMGGLGGAGGVANATLGTSLQPFVSGGAARGIQSPFTAIGGPGGFGWSTPGNTNATGSNIGLNGATSINYYTGNAPSLPYSGSLPWNRSMIIPSALAPTGGGGGGGFPANNIGASANGGRGGSILPFNPFGTADDAQNINVVPGLIQANSQGAGYENNFNTTAGAASVTSSVSASAYGTTVGVGGAGGSLTIVNLPQIGGRFGGGGGGGGASNSATNAQNGAKGGNGVIVIITEH
jgi:hypothetical protein